MLSAQYRALISESDPPETGHCAIASEAFYHLAGGKEAGFMPAVCPYHVAENDEIVFGKVTREEAEKRGWRKETHWWIRGPRHGFRGEGDVFDVTAGQYSHAFDYTQGHNAGFMQPKQIASKRAQVIIDRVTEKLGAAALTLYKQEQLRQFRKGSRSHNPAIK